MEREPIQPVVLVGGRSRRFGRDKLREPVEDGWLVDAPIRALRAVFGPVVAAVGACDPEVAARFDRVIEDRYPGAGPAGGVLSALQATGGAVFVLAGDLARITEREVRAVMAAAAGAPTAWAVMACGSRPEPCIAVYRPAMIPVLEARLGAGRRSLHDAALAERLATAPIDATAAVNVNTAADLGGLP